ncbi:MAG: hypothetical protein AABM42_01550 [Actinomycetota bacterium]
MAAIYELIGRLWVRFVRVRYRRQIRIALGIGAAGIVAGVYLAATREPPEG